MPDWMYHNLGHLLTSITILVALATFLIAFFRDRTARRIAHTADMVAHLSITDTLSEAAFQMTRFINENRRVTVATLDESTERHIVVLLDYYEYMAELYYRQVLHQRTILRLRGELIRKTYEVCQEYIIQRREDQGRSDLYRGFQRLAEAVTEGRLIRYASASD